MDENTTVTAEATEASESTTPEEVSQILGLETTPETVTTEELEKSEPDESDVEEEVQDTVVQTEEAETTDKPTEVETEVTAAHEAPAELSMEVQDADGNTITLKPGDDIEEVLKDFNPRSNGQIFAILDQFRDLKEQQKSQDEQRQADEVEATRIEHIEKIRTGWDTEIKELQGSKRIPTVVNPNSETDKGVQRISSVFKYMAEENAKRQEAGRPLIGSFEDALDKMELQETREAQAEQAKRDKEEARKRGGMVGGSSAPASGNAPVYRSGSARNASEALRVMGLSD